MKFELVGAIENIETIAEGSSIRVLPKLIKRYGHGRWKKKKGIATVKFSDGKYRRAELHWYEAHGIGRKEIKIKHLLSEE